MINLALANEKFALMADLDENEKEKWRTFTAASVQTLEAKLIDGADTEGHTALLAAAAAADAFYRYCLLEASRGDSSATVGSVTVKKDAKSQVAAASVLRSEALASVRHLLCDGGFVFKNV